MPAPGSRRFGQMIAGLARRRPGPRAAWRRFCADRGGAVAVLAAIVLLPLVLIVAAGIDYSAAAGAKAELNAAADAAALSVVNRGAMAMDATAAQAFALAYFRDLSKSTKGLSNVAATATVTDANGVRTTAVSYTATLATSLVGVAGIQSVALAGRASSTSAVPTYMDFYLMLDNSPSMGVGATTADIATMVNNTSDKCAFACHDISAGQKDYYTLAKKLGVTMRIDVVRQATQKLMDTATATAIVPGQFRAAIYTMGTTCQNVALTKVSALSSDLRQARQNAAAVDLMTIPQQGYNNDQCTDFDGILSALNLAIPVPGDGTQPAAAQKVVFFVSDGVADAYYPVTCTKPTTGGRCQEPLTVATCQAMKQRGIKIAVLYTTYLPLPTNSWYNTWIAPFASAIGNPMQACASPGLYSEVSPTQGIDEAMNALFSRTVAQARLTQ
ncbi:hypothetical protein OPKNFCMD_2581 [Methylobacterium crusticola]|uniref:Putative Flp pilus-assembly TadG-like N-terminal domain-containing protein n=1 Tax=Methylobacterium crusticola TaxID=1697972 RepID=A0ABQ4QWW4_9HYPH|nr:pilus assembly protein TadG-related protein [Methylobacterium crusticola]GJD49846.1 hypothetical protein OPKNFCMD_2581 [Methylobacterium crusticola]